MRLWFGFFFFLLTIPTIFLIPLGLAVYIKCFDIPGSREAFADLKAYNEKSARERNEVIEIIIDDLEDYVP